MRIDHRNLNQVAERILRAGGSEPDEARTVASHLVEANLSGHDSHGVGMLPTYVRNLRSDLLRPNTAAYPVRDDGPFLVFDGGRGYGQRVAAEAMAAGLERCREHGLGALGLRNAHHIGRVGSYGEQSIRAGMISLHFVNVTDHPPLVAPFGGRDARYSTNPLCVAIPGTDRTEPLLLDMATSRIALGKTRVAMNKGEKVAPGTLLDAAGEPATEPAVMFSDPRGALLPCAEHKGYGLALVCELLAGALTGGGTIQPGNERRGGIVNNMLAILIDPARLSEQEVMRREIDALVDYLKQSPPADSGQPVMVAGDPERASRAKREAEGVPVDPATWEELLAAGESLGLSRMELAGTAGA